MSTQTKTALVTGGNRGLGRDAAHALAGTGHDVVITYRGNAEEAAAVVAEIESAGRKATALQLDTGDVASFVAFRTQVEEVLRGWGADRLDALVNNGGVGTAAPFADFTPDQFDQLFAVNVRGVFFLTQQLATLIADGGRVVNLSSGLSRFTGDPAMAAYASTKGAIDVLTRYLAKELGQRKITVNAVAPGAIATDFGGGRVRDNEQIRAAIGAFTALGRVGEPDDIGKVVAMVCSDSASWITGTRIEASGGQSL